jgi:hypothetical protein
MAIIDINNFLFGKDTAYRARQVAEFQNRLLQSHTTRPLLFHGTKLEHAQSIIATGEIRPNPLHHDTDIYVTPRENVGFSTQKYARMNPERYFAAGALFALISHDAAEYEHAKTSFQMNRVNFRENPEQLFAVISTPNNVEKIEKWAQNGGIKAHICDYDEFISLLD